MNMLTSLKALLLPGIFPSGGKADEAASGESGDFAALMQDFAAPLPAAPMPAGSSPVARPDLSQTMPLPTPAAPLGDPSPVMQDSVIVPQIVEIGPQVEMPLPPPVLSAEAEHAPLDRAAIALPAALSPVNMADSPEHSPPVDGDGVTEETDAVDVDEAGSDAPTLSDKPSLDPTMTIQPLPIGLPVPAAPNLASVAETSEMKPAKQVSQPQALPGNGPMKAEVSGTAEEGVLVSTVVTKSDAGEAPPRIPADATAQMPDLAHEVVASDTSSQPATPKLLTVPPRSVSAQSTPVASNVPGQPAAPVPVAAPFPDAVSSHLADQAMDSGMSPPEVVAPAPAKSVATTASPRRSMTEVLSLLQLARDQLHNGGEAHAARGEEAVDAPVPTRSPSESFAVSPFPVTASAPQAAVQSASGPPTVDLTATLGARVVDLGVSGQWIDGLARDIARFSADGAQGRFQIEAGQLGAVQVDIRQSPDGAAVSLTVASEMAEQALRQEGDRLRTDASLSAVRISDLKIERGHVVVETARTDSGHNGASQHQSGQPGQGGWTAQGQHQGWSQSSAQSHMQGRGQGRENFGSGAKARGDAAVLKSEQAGGNAADLPRARYA